MRKYRLVAKKGEGTFSEVLKAQNVKDGKYHAIKCMKNRFESIDQVNNLREIQALRRLSPHEHVITLEEVLYDQPTGRLALVFELMDANLYELIRGRKQYLNPQLVKSYMWQLMKALDHMHRKGIFHRDIKPENILIESTTDIGKGLKLADFGSCRGIYSKQPYTEYISTRWYRAPECLLTDGYYGPEMDLWGAGCVMFEITSLYPLFPGTNEVDQISRIHKVLGAPSQEMLQKFKSKGASHISFDFPPQKGVGIPQLITHAAPEAVDLIEKMLKYDATERISARDAMKHPYFKELREAEAKAAGASAVQAATSTMANTGTVANTQAPKPVAAQQSVAQQQPSQQQQGVQLPSMNKGLPNIAGNASTSSTYQMEPNMVQSKTNILASSGDPYGTAKSQGGTFAMTNNTNKVPVISTALSQLPPIGGAAGAAAGAGAGNGTLPKVNNNNKSNYQAPSNYAASSAASNASTNMTTSNSSSNGKTKRKKYRMYSSGQYNNGNNSGYAQQSQPAPLQINQSGNAQYQQRQPQAPYQLQQQLQPVAPSSNRAPADSKQSGSSYPNRHAGGGGAGASSSIKK